MLEMPIVTKFKENKRVIIGVASFLFVLLILIIIFSGDDKETSKSSVKAPIETVEKPSMQSDEPPLWGDEETKKAPETVAPAMETEQLGDTSDSTMGTPEGTIFQSYKVVKGDSLIKIAKNIYGSAHYWTQIFDKNRGSIKNPDLIYIGQKLLIPVRKDGNLTWDKKLLINSYIETYKSYRKQEKLSTVYWLLLSGVKRIDPELVPYYLAEVKKFDRAFAQGNIPDDESITVKH